MPKPLLPILPAPESISLFILHLRGQKVMLDRDIAMLYGVPTKALNQAVKRNMERFPEDFMFQLTTAEKAELVTNCDRFDKLKHASVLPFAFTEHGIAMLSSVLNSPRAIHVNIQIMRVFAQMRQLIMASEQINRKLEALENKMEDHDGSIKMIISAIRELMVPPVPRKSRPIGFAQSAEDEGIKAGNLR